MSYDKSDEEIIASYQNGKEYAFRDLIDRYTSPIYNFVAHLTDQNNAPDIVQETFIKIWRNLNKFDSSKSSFKTWIFTIAKNTAIDFSRKKKNLLFSDLEADDDMISFSENIPDEELLPDEMLQKLQDSNLLNKILDNLPIAYKTILTLHYQEDMTFNEIGEIINKPLNTVKSQHRRALIKLRKML
ncbi:MAG: sigma-70 family RNA polymerase sigma factor [Candidatus Paceibacterota bacterium]|jgi:RNA polymerase sigma-70 factor (ECF subfamily)